MDPQRQYAQLLTLWSEGSKIYRRAQHLKLPTVPVWNAWWRLGRRLTEKGMQVLPVPFGSPALLVDLDGEWFVLCTEIHPELYQERQMAVRLTAQNALVWDGHWTLDIALALSLGRRAWETLLRWPGHEVDEFAIVEAEDARQVLGSLRRRPALFAGISPSDWVDAAKMLRHPAYRVHRTRPLPSRLGFHYDDLLQEAWWERQDEDSVHLR